MRVRDMLLVAAAAGIGWVSPAYALTINYSTSTSFETYFAGTDHEIYGGFTGNAGGTGSLLTFTAPGISENFLSPPNSISLTEGNSVHEIVNLYVRAPEAQFVHPGSGPSNNETIGFTFTIDAPTVVGANSVSGSFTHTIEMIGNDQYRSIFLSDGPNTASFDLGAEGVLDVSLLAAPAPVSPEGTGLQSGASFQPHAIFFRASFLLRDVPLQVAEPGVLMLMGSGLVGVWFARRRRAT